MRPNEGRAEVFWLAMYVSEGYRDVGCPSDAKVQCCRRCTEQIEIGAPRHRPVSNAFNVLPSSTESGLQNGLSINSTARCCRVGDSTSANCRCLPPEGTPSAKRCDGLLGGDENAGMFDKRGCKERWKSRKEGIQCRVCRNLAGLGARRRLERLQELEDERVLESKMGGERSRDRALSMGWRDRWKLFQSGCPGARARDVQAQKSGRQ